MKIEEKELQLLWLLAALSDESIGKILEFQFGEKVLSKVNSASRLFTIIDNYYKEEYPDEYKLFLEWAQELDDNFRHEGWDEFTSKLPKMNTMHDDVKQILGILTAVEHDDD